MGKRPRRITTGSRRRRVSSGRRPAPRRSSARRSRPRRTVTILYAQNGGRELGEFLLSCIRDAARLAPPHNFDKPRELHTNEGKVRSSVLDLQDAVEQLTALGRPFLNRAGKAERLSFDVPTLPLFVHERLSTASIIETLKSRRKPMDVQLDLLGDPQHSITDQVLKAYEYRDKWVNRMVLVDSLVVMNSLLQYEDLAGQVQTVYMDPLYGVKFGSKP
jgi:adenine-specific DNA-methyltransferase